MLSWLLASMASEKPQPSANLPTNSKKLGYSVVLGAADTFRAAAIDQLQIWADRVGVPIVRQQMGSDPASVAFDTLQSAVSQNADIVIIDTAGRLHNKINLMTRITKVKRVMQKVVPDAPHDVLLVLVVQRGKMLSSKQNNLLLRQKSRIGGNQTGRNC